MYKLIGSEIKNRYFVIAMCFEKNQDGVDCKRSIGKKTRAINRTVSCEFFRVTTLMRQRKFNAVYMVFIVTVTDHFVIVGFQVNTELTAWDNQLKKIQVIM